MPVTQLFPGVYIEEIPSGVHTITGVATSIAAFVDTFERGPVNYAVQLLSLTDFENIMGGLDTTSEASYAIQQFFLNGGTECYAVRVGYPPPYKPPPHPLMCWTSQPAAPGLSLPRPAVWSGTT